MKEIKRKLWTRETDWTAVKAGSEVFFAGNHEFHQGIVSSVVETTKESDYVIYLDSKLGISSSLPWDLYVLKNGFNEEVVFDDMD